VNKAYHNYLKWPN